jgi:hypothetical protein
MLQEITPEEPQNFRPEEQLSIRLHSYHEVMFQTPTESTPTTRYLML